MNSGNDGRGPARPDDVEVPPTDKRKMVLAAVLLAIPLLALLWVPSYAREEPELAGFPFFYWYQFLWVFLTSGLTWAAYRLVLSARPTRPGPGSAGDADSGAGR